MNNPHQKSWFNQKDRFQIAVQQQIDRAVTKLFESKSLPVDSALVDLKANLTTPPQFHLGQAALPCHSLSKKLRLSPIKIADELKALIESEPQTIISQVQSVAGYLNFHCNFSDYGPGLLEAIESGEFFKGPFLKKGQEKILVEYSQPNTHKSLHVGHLRNVVYGDAVCAILEYSGHTIIRVTYPGDMGAHIAKTLWFISQYKKAELEIARGKPAGDADWLGQIYADADEKLKSFAGTQDEARVKGEIGLVLKQLQDRKGDYYDLYLQTRQWSLEQMKRIYDWLGTHFDIWYFESECDEPSRELVKKKYQDGFFTLSEGAIGKDLSEWGLGFALFLKSDGNGLYLTKDLELIRRKFEDQAVNRSIVVVDARQKLHFQQLFKTAELMGYPQAKQSVHLSYESVTTEDGKAFSSRSKNGIPLEQFRAKLEETIQSQYLESYRGTWPDQQITDTAKMVGLGALKYGMLRVDSSSQIRFVLEEWMKLDGETGPYLQYVYARCQGVLNKNASERGVKPAKFVYEHPVEPELLLFLSRFNQEVVSAASDYRPSVLTAYLFDLCKLYNFFYKECHILGAENAELRANRIRLVECTSIVLKRGLGLLGIPAPLRI